MTVVARTFISVPERAAIDTWQRIVALIAPDSASAARHELAAVAGVACSCISDETPADDPIVVHGVGPQLRVYALYGDDAIEGDGANESSLSWVPTDGDWHMSIPCLPDDLAWVQSKLAKVSTRVRAREVEKGAEADVAEARAKTSSGADGVPMVDMDAFFRR